MRRSPQAFSAPSKQTQSSNAKDELSSTASINASSTTSIPSSELLASKPRDCTLKREQNSCYKHNNGLIIVICFVVQELMRVILLIALLAAWSCSRFPETV